jgi:hypothetical protein
MSLFFLFLMSAGIRYLQGGVESAFTHVEGKQHVVRLFHLKGRRNIRVKQVRSFDLHEDRRRECSRRVVLSEEQVKPEVSSLNSGDVFVLDLGDKVLRPTAAATK